MKFRVGPKRTDRAEMSQNVPRNSPPRLWAAALADRGEHTHYNARHLRDSNEMSRCNLRIVASFSIDKLDLGAIVRPSMS